MSHAPRALAAAALALSLALALAASGCAAVEARLAAIPFDPPTTPAAWCAARPCIDLGGVIWNEPLGTALVYGLAALYVVAGVRIWRERGRERSRLAWAWALILGGVAAGAAGTSYQAFSYELKCAGRELCVWTSPFEVAYLVLQSASVGCMVAAVAWSCTRGALQRALVAYAALSVALHAGVTLLGVVTANPRLLSFELLLLFSLPALLVGLGLNGTRWLRRGSALDGALFGAWLWLVATNAIHFAYGAAGLTQRFWQEGRGFHFSENDVLHVGMIGWAFYVLRVVAPRVRDLGGARAAA